jgi:hypothetical protein
MSNKQINILEIPVFYINLDEDVEKRNSLISELKNLGFKNIRRVTGVKNNKKALGVAMAHKRALETAIKTKGPFIILEDDVLIKNFNPFVEVPEDSDAFYLGLSSWGIHNGRGVKAISAEKHSGQIYRLYNMLSAHAILYLNIDYAKFLLQSVDFFISIQTNQDKGRAETMKYWKIYGNSTPMFVQNGKYYAHTNINLATVKHFDKFKVYFSRM